jgi:hypothetical protein
MLGRLKFNIEELVEEILDQIPEHVWQSDTTTFLDPAIGGGQFVVAIERRLRKYGYSSENIAKRVFGYEDNILRVNYAINKHKLVGNYQAKNFLKEKFDMKFDVVVGNPPFDQANGAKNTKLWAKFSSKALDVANEVVAFITPNNIISNKGVNGELLREEISKKGFGFIHVKNHDDNPFKSVSVDTCHWIVKKGVDNAVNPVIVNYDLTVDPVELSITDKVINSSIPKLRLLFQNDAITKKDLSVAGNPIYFSGDKLSYTELQTVGEGVLKLVLPFSASYHKMFITTHSTGMLNMAVNINSVEEGEVLKSYLLSKLFRFVASRYKKTSGFTPFVKNATIPDLSRSIVWTEQEIYDHFGLTQEEIDYVEANVK